MASDLIEEKVFLARVAEQAERFPDMVQYLSEVLDAKGGDVNADERNLLSVAFKNYISGKRASCRTITAIEQNPAYAQFSAALAGYKAGIEQQLQADCEHVIKTIQTKVMTKAVGGESRSFFVKMIGDYYRYIAETAKGAKFE